MANGTWKVLPRCKVCSKASIESAVTSALRIVEGIYKEYSRNLLAYSGGKESRVMAHLLASHGFPLDSVFETSFLFDDDLRSHRRFASETGLDLSEYSRLSNSWLKKNHHFIFADFGTMQRFYAVRQQRTIITHALKKGYCGVITGRRASENFVPRSVYRTNNGILNCHPLRDWSLEQVWGYLYHQNIPLSPMYSHPLGGLGGAAPWPTLSNDYSESWGYNTFDLVWDYDHRVIDALAVWWIPAMRYKEHGYYKGIMEY